jgi:hypothetical protein
MEGQTKFLVDQLPAWDVVPVNETNGHTACTSSSGPPNAVNVNFGILRALVIDDVGDVLNINSTGSHVSGD